MDYHQIFTWESCFLFLNLFVYGNCTAFVESFLLLYLHQDYHASKMLMGLCVFSMTMGEMVVFYFSDHIINFLTIQGSLIFSMFVYAVRCYVYTIIPVDLKYVFVFIEPSHGLTFALMWNSAVYYANQISPPHLKSTTQAIVSCNFLFFNSFFFCFETNESLFNSCCSKN